MDQINETLTLYSVLTYLCIALAVLFLAVTIFVFIRFRILNIIGKYLGIRRKATGGEIRVQPSTAQLSRSRRVSRMEYQTATSELPRKRQGSSGRISRTPVEIEPAPETTPLSAQPFFRVVKEEVIIHTSEQL